jgi:hypothetical protein
MQIALFTILGKGGYLLDSSRIVDRIHRQLEVHSIVNLISIIRLKFKPLAWFFPGIPPWYMALLKPTLAANWTERRPFQMLPQTDGTYINAKVANFDCKIALWA